MATDLPEAADTVENTEGSCPQRSEGHGNKDADTETTHTDSRHRISQQACSGKENLTGTEISRGRFWYLIKIYWMWSQKITGTSEDGNGGEHSRTGEENGHSCGYCRKLCGVSPKQQNWSYHVTHATPHTPAHRDNSQSHSYVRCKKTKCTEAETRMSATKNWGWYMGERLLKGNKISVLQKGPLQELPNYYSEWQHTCRKLTLMVLQS